MTGRVHLVGAGCGRLSWASVTAMRLVGEADVVAYDALMDHDLLDLARPGARLIPVGKRAGAHSVPQDQIARILVAEALAGNDVVRLKGGDPYVFGRGGEEAEALAAAGIPYDVTPGITSAIAIPEEAGIPVTHRGLARSLHVVTCHTREGRGLPADIDQLAAVDGTLVVLMGATRIPELARALVDAGKDPATPAAVVSGGCAPARVAVRATLATIADAANEAQVKPPAVIVVGPVAALDLTSPALARPLAGVTVGLVGTRGFRSRLAALLEAQGATTRTVLPLEVAATEPAPNLAALADGRPHWVVLTSPNGVRAFMRAAREHHVDLRSIASCRFAVVGTSTARALAEAGIYADLVPEVATTAALAEAIATADPAADAHAFRAANANEDLARGLAAHGIGLTDHTLYEVRPAPWDPGPPPDLDYLALGSAGGVQALLARREVPAGTTCACIGPVTAAELASHGTTKTIVATTHSAEGLANVIMTDHQSRSEGEG